LAVLIKIKIWKFAFRLLKLIIFVLSIPLKPLFRLISRQFKLLKKYFWKWIRNKASQYDEKDKDE
jgi:hypothetical protein